jgi:glycosyltransferase involved in cell wall biosynthesis
MERIRALVIAEAANPEWVSVPLVGWSLAAALRSVADVHIVTQTRNRDAFLRAGLVEGVDFTAIDSEAVARPMYRLASALRMGKGKGWTINTALAALAYPYFERLVWRRFGADIAAGRYDVVHRVTPLSPTTPSPIAPRCAAAGARFVLGPLNGGVPWPPGFEAERLREREWLSYLRGAYRLLPGRGATLEAASLILCGSRHTMGEIPERFRNKCVYLPENGIDESRFNLIAEDDPSGPLRACFIGCLVPYKGPDMLLEAAAPLLRSGRMTLDVIGDGPLESDLRAQAEREGLSQAVTFHGWLDHRAVAAVAARCAVMTFPSIREFGGGVVLEAMALGLVPVVVDYAGPGELIDKSVGFKTPIGSRAEIVAGFRETLDAVLARRADLPAIAERARARVRERYLWPRKAERIAELYAQSCAPAE